MPNVILFILIGREDENSPNKKKNAVRETTYLLKMWLQEHQKNPYPTKEEKVMLAMATSLNLTQISTWFANARRRLKKENRMTWSVRSRTAATMNATSPQPPPPLAQLYLAPTDTAHIDIQRPEPSIQEAAAAWKLAREVHEKRTNQMTLDRPPQPPHPSTTNREPDENEAKVPVTQNHRATPKIWSLAALVESSSG